MSKQPARTWTQVVSLGIPLAVVGASAMAISYATLIDVARVNGLPLPELFPILIDVGTVAAMIAAAQFRVKGLPGRWLAYVTFLALSGVSIVANATHAWRAADMTVTSPWASALLAATPPAALLAITHLVMMLIPDQKERAKLASAKERRTASQPLPFEPHANKPEAFKPDAFKPLSATPRVHAVTRPTSVSDAEVEAQVREYIELQGSRPTGALVGEWLGGKSAKTGQRFLTRILDGEAIAQPAPSMSVVEPRFELSNEVSIASGVGR